MIRKTGQATIKAMNENGSGSAVFATLGVVDKDGDLTIPGAFGDQMAKFVGAHNWGEPSIGGAKVREEGNLAIADFQINLDMAQGQEWYKSLKFNFDNGIPQEFSYGFDVVKFSYKQEGSQNVRVLEQMKVHEVSPVMVGAGINTHLRSMKNSRSMDEHFETVLFEVDDFMNRANALIAIRTNENRTPLSQTMKERLNMLSQKLTGLVKTSDVLSEEVKTAVPIEIIADLRMRRLKTEARLAGRL